MPVERGSIRSPTVVSQFPMRPFPNVGLYKIDRFEFCAGTAEQYRASDRIFQVDEDNERPQRGA